MNKNKKFISKYFEKDLYKATEEMTNDEMINQIKELEDTRYWVAITKYVQDRMIIAQSSLCAIDPFKMPTEICRAQGILSGLLDLHDMVTKTKETVKQAEKKAQAKNDQTPDVEIRNDEPSYNV